MGEKGHSDTLCSPQEDEYKANKGGLHNFFMTSRCIIHSKQKIYIL